MAALTAHGVTTRTQGGIPARDDLVSRGCSESARYLTGGQQPPVLDLDVAGCGVKSERIKMTFP